MFYRLAILAAHSSNSVVGANIVLRRAATTDLVQNSRRYVQNIHSPLGSITVSLSIARENRTTYLSIVVHTAAPSSATMNASWALRLRCGLAFSVCSRKLSSLCLIFRGPHCKPSNAPIMTMFPLRLPRRTWPLMLPLTEVFTMGCLATIRNRSRVADLLPASQSQKLRFVRTSASYADGTSLTLEPEFQNA